MLLLYSVDAEGIQKITMQIKREECRVRSGEFKGGRTKARQAGDRQLIKRILADFRKLQLFYKVKN